MNDEKLFKLLEKSQTLKVLYVEDDDEVREQTYKMFSDFFGDIHVAINGLEALEIFKSEEFDLVITDISMPKMDGIKMSKHIREINTAVPIIVMSAHNEDHIFEDVKKYNITKYLFKPLNLEDFIETLDCIAFRVEG